MKITFIRIFIRRLAIIAIFTICWSALPMAVALNYVASQWHTVAMAVTAIAIKLKETYYQQKRLEYFTIKNLAHGSQNNQNPTISYDTKQASTIHVSDTTLQVPISLQPVNVMLTDISARPTATQSTTQAPSLEPAVKQLVNIPNSLVAQERTIWSSSVTLASKNQDNAHLSPQPLLSGDMILIHPLQQVAAPHPADSRGQSKTHISMSLTSRQMSSQARETYRNLAALSRIGQNEQSRELFKQHYAQFQANLFACLNAKHQSALFNALVNLSDAESNYYQLTNVPFLRERMMKAVNEIQHLLLNKEGALLPGFSEQNTIQIARIIAEFSTPLNGTYADFSMIVQQMVDNKIPGALGLQHQLETQSRQALIFRLVDFFTPGRHYTSLSAAFKNNPLTKAIIELNQACAESRWEHAENVVRNFSHTIRSQSTSGQPDESAKVLNTIFNELAFERGIFKKYQHHPSYQSLINSPGAIRQSSEINNVLAEQHRLKQELLDQLGITQPSALVDQLAYQVATHFYDPLAVNRILSGLSADHPDRTVREAFHAFFDSRGLCKLSRIAQTDQTLRIPEGLALEKNSVARNLVHTLTHIDAPTALAAEEIKRAVEYVNLACSEHPRAQEYLVLAQAIADAHISADADSTILKCGDFSLLNETPEQIVLQDALVRTAAELCTSLSRTTNEADRAELKSALLALEATRNTATTSTVDKVIQKSFHQTVLLPKLEKLKVIVPGIMTGAIIIKKLVSEQTESASSNTSIEELDSHVQFHDAQNKKNNEKDNGKDKESDAQAPGKPTEKDGFIPKKNWDGKKVKHRKGYGWPDKRGSIWIPTGPNGHGGPHWDVQHPDKSYDNVVPGGKIRGQK